MAPKGLVDPYSRTRTHNPVSYTHLDVYKRQAYDCPICTQEASVVSVKPTKLQVSFLHLIAYVLLLRQWRLVVLTVGGSMSECFYYDKSNYPIPNNTGGGSQHEDITIDNF